MIDLRGLARFGVGPFRECVEEASKNEFGYQDYESWPVSEDY